MAQTQRLYWIDAQIRAGQFPNAESVCECFGVSRRTAYNDRDILCNELNAPLVYDHQRGGWTYTDPTYLLPFLALTEREATALRLSLLAAQEYLEPADAEAVERLAHRLSAYSPTQIRGGHEIVRGSIRLDGSLPSSLSRDCRRCVDGRHRLSILYYSPREDALTERVVRPYELLHWRGEPYLISFCELRQDMRQFFLGRIREWQVLEPDAAFARDPDFDIQTYLSRGFDVRHGEDLVTARVRFSPYQARWIRERRYHLSQQNEEQADGSLIVTLSVAGTEEVRRWLLGYGAEVEVLEPESLRVEIAKEAKKVQQIYNSRL